MACYLKEKDIRNKEEESNLPNDPEVVLLSPTHVQSKDQRSGDKGRIVNSHATVLLNVFIIELLL